MIFVRLLVASAAFYIYGFVLEKLVKFPPLKQLSNNFITGLTTNVIGVIIFLGVLLWPFYMEVKLRSSELKKIATGMGFVFHDGDFQPDPYLLHSPLFRRGYRHGFGSAITGKHNGVDILMFTHVFSEPEVASDTGDTRYFRTVVVFHSPEIRIPEFTMLAKGLGDRVFESIFGSGNIYFKDDPNFSKRYALTGPNQESVRKFFVPRLRLAFTGLTERWAAGGIDNRLILFADDKLDEQIKPDAMVDYLEKTWKMFEIAASKT